MASPTITTLHFVWSLCLGLAVGYGIQSIITIIIYYLHKEVDATATCHAAYAACKSSNMVLADCNTSLGTYTP